MPEILTESFCERCGTRYTFEAAIPKKRRIGKLKVLSKGLRNYVLSDDASLDEALAEARSEEQRELTGGQLDAFHQAFQFCMSCRQYTCANCWNEPEGRCLSCAPLSTIGGQLHSPLDDLLAGGGMAPFVSQPTDPDHDHSHSANGNGNGNGHALVGEPPAPAVNGSAWPTIDLFRTEPEPAAPPASDSVVATEPQPVIETPPEAAPPADFWAHPFTGFAPVVESTNGHDAEGAPAGPDADDAPAAEAEAVEITPIEEPDVERIARAVSPLMASEPEPALEPIQAEAPVEAQVEAPVEAQVEAPVEAPRLADADVDARADELAARTSRLLGRFRVQPRSAATPAAAAQPAPVIEPEPESRLADPEPVLAPEPPVEATASAPQPILEPEAAAPEPTLAPEPPSPRIDRIEMPAWPTPTAPAAPMAPTPPAWRLTPAPPPLPTPANLEPLARPEPAPTPAPGRPPFVPSAAPQWPAPLRPGVDLSAPAPWASRDTSRDAGLWMASAQEVTAASSQAAVPGGVQSCVSCGLSLSATARFCRRCGSAQG